MIRFLLSLFMIAPSFAARTVDTQTVPDKREQSTKAWTAQVARLQNIQAEYLQREETLIERDPVTEFDGQTFMLDDATREKAIIFRHRDHVVRYEARITDEFLDRVGDQPGDILEQPHMIEVFRKDGHEKLIKGKSDGKWFGNLQDAKPIPRDLVIDRALGLRTGGRNAAWVDEELIKRSSVEQLEGGHVQATYQHEGRVHTWRFDPKKGYALVRYAIRSANSEFEWLIIENSRFRNINGLLLPMRIEQNQFLETDGEVTPSFRTIIDVEAYTVGDADNTVESLRIDWPAGIVVYEGRAKAEYRVDERGELQPIGGDSPNFQALHSHDEADRDAAHHRAAIRSHRGWWTLGIGVLAALVALIINPQSFRRNVDA